jgi:hypothetical protein
MWAGDEKETQDVFSGKRVAGVPCHMTGAGDTVQNV